MIEPEKRRRFHYCLHIESLGYGHYRERPAQIDPLGRDVSASTERPGLVYYRHQHHRRTSSNILCRVNVVMYRSGGEFSGE
jgi:hypothetical protein